MLERACELDLADLATDWMTGGEGEGRCIKGAKVTSRFHSQ